MYRRIINILTSVVIVTSSLFIIFFVTATKTTLFSSLGSSLNQGYIGKDSSINLNNFAVGALVFLIVGMVVNYALIRKQSNSTRIARKIGLVLLLLILAWFLYLMCVVVYLLLSGRFMDGWQF